MKETLKRIKADVILSAILCVALGVILMIWPTQVTKVLCYILAAILCVMGIGHIISYMRNKLESRLGLATGIALVIFGCMDSGTAIELCKDIPGSNRSCIADAWSGRLTDDHRSKAEW